MFLLLARDSVSFRLSAEIQRPGSCRRAMKVFKVKIARTWCITVSKQDWTQQNFWSVRMMIDKITVLWLEFNPSLRRFLRYFGDVGKVIALKFRSFPSFEQRCKRSLAHKATGASVLPYLKVS